MRRAHALLIAASLLAACATPQKTREVEVKEDRGVEEQWRRNRPQPGEPVPLRVPKFSRTELPNGLTVIVSERHDLPIVAVSVALRTGSAADPEGKAGLARLTYQLLLEGAGKLDAAALDQAFADLGTSASADATHDGGFVAVDVMTERLDAAMELLADIVLHPRFDPASFQHRKEQTLSTLAYQVGNPSFLGMEAMAATLYGESHPYGRTVSGTPETVSSLTLEDARAFWKRAAVPSQAAVVFAGDITMDRAVELATRYFGQWKGQAVAQPEPPTPAVEPRRRIVVVPKPGLQQTLILVGRPALRAGDPDEYPLELANAVFGGLFGSRLNMNLREAKGYTYGARSSVDARRGVGPLIAYSQVRADVTGPALVEVFAELQGLRERPITEEELEGAREGRIRSMPGWFETVGALASAGSRLFWLDLPLDHYDQVLRGLETATPAQVRQVGEAYLDPELMQVVLVGDPEIIRAQVEPLGLGELVFRQPPAIASIP